MTPTPAPKFKVGDRVKCLIDVYEDGRWEEYEGTVVEVNKYNCDIETKITLNADKRFMRHAAADNIIQDSG